MCSLITGQAKGIIVMTHLSPQQKVSRLSFWVAVDEGVGSSDEQRVPDSPKDEG